MTGVAVGDGGGIVGFAPDAKAVFLKVQSASICGQNGLDGDIIECGIDDVAICD